MTGQRTLKQEIRAKSVSLQTGEEVSLTIRPAPVDTGIVFRRIDLDP
ncbi:MAG TPA: UDP-3-O-[3-hydroxymyristoyl] N-acetylglucosamine deacetylase, partial [Gammaproteobacteria bacterium]|nr:UDP-3-O-[3-hydroxymyristoyl] N-acetylglucosamine deacetylase [Gammaproteobacteria bacterium]